MFIGETYVGDGAAAPFLRLLHEATAGVSRAAGPVVTHDLGWLSWTRNRLTGLLLQGCYLLQPWQAGTAALFTGLYRHVTSVAFGTAVLAVAAAHGLRGSKVTLVQIPSPL